MRILAILMGSIVSSSISCTLLALILTVLYPMIRCSASKFRGLKRGRWGNTQPENHAETIRYERYFTGDPCISIGGVSFPLNTSDGDTGIACEITFVPKRFGTNVISQAIPVSPSEVLSGKETPLRMSFSLAVAMLYFFSPFLSRSQRAPSPLLGARTL